MTLETNSDGTSSVRIKLAQVISITGAIASILGIFVFIGGFISGERYLSAELAALRETVVDLRAETKATQNRLGDLSLSVAVIKEDTSHIKEDVAKLTLAAIPRR